MVEVWLPYGGSEVAVRVPEESLLGILKPESASAIDPSAEMKRLVASNPDFQMTVKRAERICIAIGGSRNGTLPEQVVNTLLLELGAIGVGTNRITVLCTPDAPIDKSKLPTAVSVMQHSLTSPTSTIEGLEADFVPETSKVLLDSQVRIVLGELWPNPVLGFSGLSDVVFPELGSEKSIRSEIMNRKPLSPIDLYKERLRIASLLPNLIGVGYVLNENRQLARMEISPFSDCVSNLEGTVREKCTVSVERTADIVIMSAGGKPMDDTLLRAVEAFPNGLNTMKRSGALIVAAECSGGHGGTDFYAWSKEKKEARHLEARLRRTFNVNGWKAAYLARALQTRRIYLVSTIPDGYVENTFGLRAAKTVNAALLSAQRAIGEDSKIIIFPDASGVIATLKAEQKAE